MAMVMMIAMMVMIGFGMYDNGDHIGVVMMMRMMTRLIMVLCPVRLFETNNPPLIDRIGMSDTVLSISFCFISGTWTDYPSTQSQTEKKQSMFDLVGYKIVHSLLQSMIA